MRAGHRKFRTYEKYGIDVKAVDNEGQTSVAIFQTMFEMSANRKYLSISKKDTNAKKECHRIEYVRLNR